jgi:hypothetical protein
LVKSVKVLLLILFLYNFCNVLNNLKLFKLLLLLFNIFYDIIMDEFYYLYDYTNYEYSSNSSLSYILFWVLDLRLAIRDSLSLLFSWLECGGDKGWFYWKRFYKLLLWWLLLWLLLLLLLLWLLLLTKELIERCY